MRSFVLDASVAAAWCFHDESSEYTEGMLDRLASGEEARVPALWRYEVANVLLNAQRSKRVTQAKVLEFLDLLNGLRITTDAEGVTRVFEQVISLAAQHGLTVYDAAYLELAMREGLPLATLDATLRRAAGAVGVETEG